MKKTLTTILFIFILQFSASAQLSTFDTVYNQFIELYQHRLSKNKNYFEAIDYAAKLVLRLNNKSYAYLVKNELEKQHLQSANAVSEFIYDSIMNVFLKKGLWIDNQTAKEKYKDFFQPAFEKVCNCITPYFSTDYKKRGEKTPLDSCMMLLNNDASYVQNARSLASKYSQREIVDIGRYFSRFIFENCSAFKNDLISTVKYSSASLYEIDLNERKRQILDTIIQNYANQNFENLAYYYPAYKQFETDLSTTTKSIYNKKFLALYDQTPKVSSPKQTIIKTFYTYENEKAKLICRIVYDVTTIKGQVIIERLKYIPAELIPRRKKILKELNNDEGEEIIIGLPAKQ